MIFKTITFRDAKLIISYIKRSKGVLNSAFLKSIQPQLSFKINISREKGVSMSRNQWNENDLKAFLLDFRPLYLQEEPISVLKIVSTIGKYGNEDQRKRIKSLKKIYVSTLSKSEAPFFYFDRELKPKEIIDIWFYGEYFHQTDELKTATLEDINNHVRPLFEHLFVLTLTKIVEVISNLAKIGEEILISDQVQVKEVNP